MDKEKFEKMFEMMKECCKNEEGMADCCAMMKKMMKGKIKETEKKKKDNEEKE